MNRFPEGSGNQYNNENTVAVRMVLTELSVLLGPHRDHYVLIGGLLPWVMFPEAEEPHAGTNDIDIVLDAENLKTDKMYADLIETLENAGYRHRTDPHELFQMERTVTVNGRDVEVVVDFLKSDQVDTRTRKPRRIQNFRILGLPHVDEALRHKTLVVFDGVMPDSTPNRVRFHLTTLPVHMMLKGRAVMGRFKDKDLYDIVYTLEQFGHEEAARECLPFFQQDPEPFEVMGEKFRHDMDYGPLHLRLFYEQARLPTERTLDQIQQDSYARVQAFLSHLRQLSREEG